MAKDSEVYEVTKNSANTVEQELAALTLLEKKEARQKVKEDKDITIAARLANMESIKEGHKKREAVQAACPHQKPYGESAIAGQRLHSHKYLWICQTCQKTWFDGELPTHLRINSEFVGGPSF